MMTPGNVEQQWPAAASTCAAESSFGAILRGRLAGLRTEREDKIGPVRRNGFDAARELLSRFVAFAKTRYAHKANRRMRVTEMVPLGEKRFVALLKIDGQELLIGGGTSGVSLLATMELPSTGTAVNGPAEGRE